MAAPKGRSRCRSGSSDHGARAQPRRGPALVRRGAARRQPSRLTSASSRPSPPCRASASPAPDRGVCCTMATATGPRLTPIRASSITMCWWRSTRSGGSISASRRCGPSISTGSACRKGDRVLQLGAGSGYYTAILAELAGPRGRVDALEIDEALAAAAQRNLEASPAAQVRCADASAADRGAVGRDRGFRRRRHARSPGGSTRWPTADACCCR